MLCKKVYTFTQKMSTHVYKEIQNQVRASTIGAKQKNHEVDSCSW